MAHPEYLRQKARQMRTERRMTIDEITARLGLPRTTIYYWVRDLTVPRSAFDPRPASEARKRASQANKRRARLKREAAYEQGRAEYVGLLADPTFRDFVCLYLAEGYKRDRNKVSLGNSDPAVVRLAHRWITQLSSRNRVGHSIQYHADQDLRKLRRFWGDQLGLDPEVIVLQRKSNSNQLSGRTWRSEHGVLTVAVCDTMLRARIQAWMDLLSASWA